MKNDAGGWLKQYNLLIFEDIDSTNEEAKRLVKAGVNSDLVIWAKSQTKNNLSSRNGLAPISGNLHLSILLFPKEDILYSSGMSFVASVAVGQMLANFHPNGGNVSYKWPNEIKIDDRTVAQILLEPYSDYLIIGVEINILELEINKAIDEFMKSFNYWFDIWKKKGLNPIREKWLSKRNNIGEVITVIFGNNRISGVFEDITENGSIKIILAGGQEYYIKL
ncbi:Bifunctional ligase/repressor BirA [Candidatus Arcanobacter lacustris]|jgi:BirA family biotin operon repressor/biotin-[acetyl-CoA-carboxylase] ligase|uniref:Bifunctional ligase/repressor BirA n=1 Tax=Candidatus Arcanibacter lacustris TaxID=1607817 RepID=A0A0F5MPQ0_9RICK|nr:Bifunctional ligase/repressor BirA [Candidatus Arcanobacter lacustris]